MFKKLTSSIFSFTRGIAGRINWSIDTFGYVLLMILFCVTPVFFLPLLGITLFTAKIVFVTLLVAFALFVYSFAVLAQGTISLPKDWTFLLLVGLMATGVLSAVFSGSVHYNLLGYMGEVTTGFFIVLVGIIIFLGSRFIATFERISGIYMGLIGMSILFALYHIARFILGPGFLSFGVIPFSTGSLVGTWNDLAIFFGGALFLIVLTLEFLAVRKLFKTILLVAALVFSGLLLVINFKLVWIILGILSFLTALYVFSFAYWDAETKTYKKETRIPLYTLILFVFAVLGILFGSGINNIASRYQNVAYTEVRPSVTTTLSVATKSLSKNFATGTGLNSFNSLWHTVKPQNISGTDFGNANFQVGFGLIPTYMSLTGIIGIVLWVLFIGFLVLRMVKILTQSFDHPMSRFFTVSLILTIGYFLIFAFVYTISMSLIITLSLLIGGFFGILRTYGHADEIELVFIKDPRASFFGIILLIAIMIFSVFGGYLVVRKFNSLYLFQRGSLNLRQGKADQGILDINRALALSNSDVFHRELSMMAIGNIQEFLNSDQVQKISKEEVSANAQKLASIAIAHSQAAIDYNKSNAQNWVNQGDVFRFMTRIGVADAYDKAIASYTEAQKRSPKDTTMDLYFAQLEIAKGNVEKAKELIKNSIDKQPTRDAYVLKYQIALSEKDFPTAFASLRQAITLDSYNAGLYYEYGILALTRGQNTEAAAAFNQTLTLDQSYVQAYFYLVVALEKADQMEAATAGREFLRKQNPDTDKIIEQIRSSLAGVSNTSVTPATTAPTTPAPASADAAVVTKPVTTTPATTVKTTVPAAKPVTTKKQ